MASKHALRLSMKRAAPTILSCLGCVGVVATAVLSARATPKALERIETDGASTKTEALRAGWRFYIPAASIGALTIGCILGANVLNRKQQASILAAYAMACKSFQDYKQEVRRIYGEEGHQKVMKALAVSETEKPCIYESIFGQELDFPDMTEEQMLFHDNMSKRYFHATPSQVALAEMHTNRNLSLNGDVGVEDFYDFLGLDTPEDMKPLFWFVSDSYTWIDFTHSKILIDDGPGNEPLECWMIEPIFPPTLEPLEGIQHASTW